MTAYLKGAKGSWMWLVIRLYIGYQWMIAGWHKIEGEGPWSAEGYLKGVVAKSVAEKPTVKAWWGSFIDGFALPNVGLFNFLIPWGEFLVGLALIAGFATIFAACMGALMNFAFLMSGSSSSNPYLFALEFILVAAGGAYAGYLGVDYWFRPWFRSQMAKIFGTADSTAKSVA